MKKIEVSKNGRQVMEKETFIKMTKIDKKFIVENK
jgi:hypothetical protein